MGKFDKLSTIERKRQGEKKLESPGTSALKRRHGGTKQKINVAKRI